LSNRPKPTPKVSKQQLWHFGKAAALITGALLLKKLPSRAASFKPDYNAVRLKAHLRFAVCCLLLAKLTCL
jgi:hypothetical protein